MNLSRSYIKVDCELYSSFMQALRRMLIPATWIYVCFLKRVVESLCEGFEMNIKDSYVALTRLGRSFSSLALACHHSDRSSLEFEFQANRLGNHE